MRALVCERPGEAELRDLPEPIPGPGDVVVRVAAALTCGTDLKLMRRGHPKIPFPVTLGHELAGVVHAAGEGAPFSPGERVACGVSGPCGECPDCRSGQPNLCPSAFGDPVFGAFAEYVRVPARVVLRQLRAVREGLPFEAAALLDPLASVLHGLSRAPIMTGETLLVYGSGPIAMLFAILGRIKDVKVLVAGRHPARFPLFVEQAARPFEVTGRDAAAEVAKMTAGRGADVVVDTTGDPDVAAALPPLARRGGAVLLFAGMKAGTRVGFDAGRIHYDEVTVTGSFHYTPDDLDRALELIVAGRIPLHAMVTARRPLSEWKQAFDDLANGRGMKTALIP